MIHTIKYGKSLDLITDTSVQQFRISQLSAVILNMNYFDMILGDNVMNKTIAKIQKAGFCVVVDEDYGFDWEVRLICNR